MPGEHPRSGVGRVGIGQVRVVHGVGGPVADCRPDVEQREGPDVAAERHQGNEQGEDDERERRHQLAAAAVGDHGDGKPPPDLGDGGDERDGAQSGIAQAEGLLDVGAEQADAVAHRPGDEGGRGEQGEGRHAAFPQHVQERGRLALACPRDEVEGGDRFGVTAAGDRFAQQLVGDGEAEERRLPGHGPTSASAKPAATVASDTARTSA